MRAIYANVIIDISHESVDRTFQYLVPQELEGEIQAGQQVFIPFGAGNTRRRGYVVELTETAEYDPKKIKEIAGIVPGSVSAQSQLIWLAWWMKERYGSTMNQALKTVLPVKQKVKSAPRRQICCLLSPKELDLAIDQARKKKYSARLRLLAALKESPALPYSEAVSQLGLTPASLKAMEEKGMIQIQVVQAYRNPLAAMDLLPENGGGRICLNQQQQAAADGIWQEYSQGIRRTYLIHGITGSGKTEVYMELIARVTAQGKQVIVLIPEISLTWQTVMRFYRRFGDRVSVMNSRLSQGEKYDQYQRALQGEIDIMIGPRSALFTPFERLGLIIIDEEHENAYKSELSPRYHAREVARERARQCQASLVLGSATPSLESYTLALKGVYGFFSLNRRARMESMPAQVEIVDLRKELAQGNKSIFSRRLMERMEDRLEKNEQIMLFINRRGYANFVSCRSCGQAMRCPHCDVTLTLHRDGRLMCHYCGYWVRQPKICPACGSAYIAPFGTGTQKIEDMVKKMFPKARVLRMDSDTTSKKEGHQEILSSFARGEADILVGTQMIVKGHDFPRVTLVGALAADLSLLAPDYRCAEQTFDLLTQAAGRAGRAGSRGNMVIQTYQPDHYSIKAAADQNYEEFYAQEMAFRRLLGYPPAVGLLSLQMSCREEAVLERRSQELADWIQRDLEGMELKNKPEIIGPVNAAVYKVNDIYRKFLYIKHENYDILIQIRKRADQYTGEASGFGSMTLQYDLT